uniref:GPI inositol-deacylase n=1 Tax=Hirondellea gigas TaxID=1518452 RepID=A0A2P2I3Q9_9CRUS
MDEAAKGGGFNIKYLIIGVLFTLQLVGVYEHVWNVEPNLCEMTYMWQHPEYVPIDVPSEVASKFPRYGLYSYGEGQLTALLTAGQYSGQPVLFLPGSGGSYKQVRSLASVAYRKSLDEEGEDKRRFDFFTADFAEDLAGLYGPALEDQTAFVTAVIPVIQSLYMTTKPVILIGHSMGGLVARAVLLSDNMDSSTVPIIVTMATSHITPPLPLDQHMHDFYNKVNSYWALERVDEGAVSNVAVVSVGGGRNDVQVSPLGIASPFSHVTSLTTAVPGCYATTDHLSIVWCKQLVLALVRGLFDSLDKRTNAIHNSTSRITAIFDYHLITRHSGKQYVSSRYKRQLKLPGSAAQWTENNKRQFEYQQPARSKNTYLMVPLTGLPKSKYYSATVRARGLDENEWIFACTAAVTAESGDTKTCTSGMNLSKNGRLLGGSTIKRGKMARVELRPLLEEGYTHLVINIPPTENKVIVAVDVHGETERRTSIATPRLVWSFKPTPVIKTTPPKAILHEIVLEGLNEPWHSYDVLVRPSVSCPVNSSSNRPPQLWLTAHTSHRIADVQYKVEDKEYVFRVEQDEIAILSSADKDSDVPERGDLTVQLILEPKCSYSVNVKASLPGTFRRMLMLYGAQVPAFIVCHLMVSLAMQLKSVGDMQHCPTVLTSLLALTPMVVVPFVKLSAMLLKKLDIYNDQQLLLDSGIDIGVLPIYLFLAWMPVTLLLSSGVWLLVLGAGNVLHSSVVKIFGATTGAGELAADLALTGLSKVPAVVAVALLAVSFSTCGALAMALATTYYFIQIFYMYKDHVGKVMLKMIPRLEDEIAPEPPASTAATATATTDTTTTTTAVSTDTTTTTTTSSTTTSTATSTSAETTGNRSNTTTASSSSPTGTNTSDGIVITKKFVAQSNESLSLHLHLSMLLLCIVTTVLQFPSLIMWAVHMKHGGGTVDPTLWPSVACLASLAVIWQCNPRHDRVHYKALGQLVHAVSVLALVFASISLYRLPYLVAAIFALVALHQLFAPNRVLEDKEKTE